MLDTNSGMLWCQNMQHSIHSYLLNSYHIIIIIIIHHPIRSCLKNWDMDILFQKSPWP